MDELRREEVFDTDTDELWRAVSDERMLELWLGDEVELDPVEGGEVRVVTGGEERTGRVEEVDEGSRIAFTWARPGEDWSLVELTVLPDPAGARLVVVESPPAFGPVAMAGSWRTRLEALGSALLLVAA